jgi:hypothetical protein
MTAQLNRIGLKPALGEQGPPSSMCPDAMSRLPQRDARRRTAVG